MLEKLQHSVKTDPSVMIYFQNDSCAPCRALRPKLTELLDTKYPKIKMHLVNPVNHPECTAPFDVFSLPTILVFFDGKEFYRGGIYASIHEIEETINRYYKMLFE